LRAREYRYFSPALDLESKTRRAHRLINVALTNRPAMKEIQPLVASEDSDPKPETGTTQEAPIMSQLLKLLGADDETAACVLVAEREKSHTELLAEHTALKTKLASAEAESTKLAERITALETEKAKGAHEALITKLSEDGKLAPSLHDWARTISTEALSAFAEKAPTTPAEPKQPAVDTVTLSDEDERLIQLHGIDRAKFIAARKAERAAAAR